MKKRLIQEQKRGRCEHRPLNYSNLFLLPKPFAGLAVFCYCPAVVAVGVVDGFYADFFTHELINRDCEADYDYELNYRTNYAHYAENAAQARVAVATIHEKSLLYVACQPPFLFVKK